MSKYKYIKPSAIKAMVKAYNGKRVSSRFLDCLDAFVERKVKDSALVHNGGRKTITPQAAGAAGINKF
jgi:histone H3/H4